MNFKVLTISSLVILIVPKQLQYRNIDPKILQLLESTDSRQKIN